MLNNLSLDVAELQPDQDASTAAFLELPGYDRQMTGWIDYLVASDVPEGKAILAEFRDRAWAHGQLMQFIAADPANINDETFARMEEGQELENELQASIAVRGKALLDAGRAPADKAAFKAWRATWVPLASHIAVNDGPMPRA